MDGNTVGRPVGPLPIHSTSPRRAPPAGGGTGRATGTQPENATGGATSRRNQQTQRDNTRTASPRGARDRRSSTVQRLRSNEYDPAVRNQSETAAARSSAARRCSPKHAWLEPRPANRFPRTARSAPLNRFPGARNGPDTEPACRARAPVRRDRERATPSVRWQAAPHPAIKKVRRIHGVLTAPCGGFALHQRLKQSGPDGAAFASRVRLRMKRKGRAGMRGAHRPAHRPVRLFRRALRRAVKSSGSSGRPFPPSIIRAAKPYAQPPFGNPASASPRQSFPGSPPDAR